MKPCCESLFSSSVAFLIMLVASQKPRPFTADFSRGNRYKSAGASQESMEDAAAMSHCSLLRNTWPKPTGVAKEKPTVESLFFGAFPSDGVHKATKDVNVQKFPSCSKFCKLYQRIPGNFLSYYV